MMTMVPTQPLSTTSTDRSALCWLQACTVRTERASAKRLVALTMMTYHKVKLFLPARMILVPTRHACPMPIAAASTFWGGRIPAKRHSWAIRPCADQQQI